MEKEVKSLQWQQVTKAASSMQSEAIKLEFMDKEIEGSSSLGEVNGGDEVVTSDVSIKVNQFALSCEEKNSAL